MDLKAFCLCHKRRLTKALLIMKFTAFLLLSACLTASANGFSQQITLSSKNVPLTQVFREIQKQSGYQFLYTRDLMKEAGMVTVELRNASLQEAVAACLTGKGLTYEIIDRTVVIKKKPEPAHENTKENLSVPPIDVKGRLVNENGEPVAGATVTVKGTKNATSTDSNGEFVLKGIDGRATLVFSSTNIESLAIKLDGRTALNVSAKTRVSKLDEVQIIAYGTTTQRYNVGSVVKVTSEEISKQPVSNALAALQGRVAGLVISNTSGIPGSSFKIQIRGQNTLNPTTDNNVMPFDNPLIIIDGIPFAPNNNNINQLMSLGAPGTAPFYKNQYGGISPLNSISPSDIESIEVLRDADATSIYGSRAANGVVIITTKKGQPGKIKTSTSIYQGITRIGRSVELLNVKEYLEIRREAFANDGLTPDISNAPDLLVYDTTKDTDWKKYFLANPGTTTDMSTQVTGGSSATNFRLSGNFHRETFMMPGDFDDKRIGLGFNMHHETANKRLSIDFGTTYSYNVTNSGGNADALTGFLKIPNFPDMIDKDGNLVWEYKGLQLGPLNSLQYLKRKYQGKGLNFLTNLSFKYQVFGGLSFIATAGYSSYNYEEISMTPIAAMDPSFSVNGGSADFGDRVIRSWTIEPKLDYVKTFGKGRLNALLGTTFQKNTGASSIVSGYGYTNDLLLGSLAGAGTIQKGGFSNTMFKFSSMYGRINYIYDARYIVNVTARRDASSRFGPGKQIGDFGSIGLGWIFSETRLIKDKFSLLSYGKIRASYGTTGSDAIGDYQFLDYWMPYSQDYQGSVVYNPTNLYNPDYSWAVNKKLEVGLESGFLNNRIMVNAAWYRNRCGNQLIAYLLPLQTGFANVVRNHDAVVENSGWDAEIRTTNIKTKNITWTSSLNINTSRNKLVSFPGIESSSYSETYIVGQSTSAMKVFHYKGVNPATGVFDFYSKANGTTYNPDYFTDRSVTIDPTPKYTGGFSNSVSYRSLQLDVFIEFRKQVGENLLKSIYSGSAIGSRGYNLPTLIMSRWQKPGDVSDIQRVTTQYSGPVYEAAAAFPSSDAVYSDASFIKFRNIAISYNVSKDFLKRLRWAEMQLYLQGQNLITITRYKGADPETQSYFNVPPVKTVVAGIKINL